MMVYNRYDNRINVIDTKHLVTLVYLTHQRQSKHPNQGVLLSVSPSITLPYTSSRRRECKGYLRGRSAEDPGDPMLDLRYLAQMRETIPLVTTTLR